MKKTYKRLFITAAFISMLLLASVGCSDDGSMLIDSMDDPSKWGSGGLDMSDKDPYRGKSALLVHIPGGVENRNKTVSRGFSRDPKWNKFDGFSFRIKGDGSDDFGCILVVTGRGRVWMAVFPIKESKWHEVKTAWKDLIPGRTILPDLGASDGFRPGDIKYIHFGKSWNFNIYHKSPEITFSVDELKLIKGIQGTRSRVGLEKFPPLKNAVRKLRSRKSVTILALGDSITWGNGVGGNANAYPASLGKMLKTYYKNINIKVENRAIGGSTTVKARRWLMRDIKGIEADIVTVMFGYNEMPKSVEEREKYTEAFTKQLITYLEEVAGLMKTPPACIIITTIPGKKKHWETLDCYAVGIREIGRKYKNITIADINKHFKGIGRNGYIPYMRNEAHPSAKGYQEMADQLFKIITGKIKNK